MKVLNMKLYLLVNIMLVSSGKSGKDLLLENTNANSAFVNIDLVDGNLIENESMTTGNSTAGADTALPDKSAKDFVRGKELLGESFEEDKTSGSSNGLGYIPLGLLALVVIVPLLLLPVLFLFTRRSSFEDLNDGTPDLLHVLNVDYTLLPTHPSGDPFLRDKSVWSDIVQVNAKQNPFYRLTPQNAFIRPRTGQLYHPQSGLLFTPLRGCSFNGETGRLDLNESQFEKASTLPAHLHLVYEEDTHYVYEPTLSLAYNGHQWHLAVAPVTDVQPMRRAQSNELPESLQQMYANLLTTVNSSPSLSDNLPQNPLIMSKIDFSKLQPADMMTTPRMHH